MQSFFRDHPILVVILILCTGLGALLGYLEVFMETTTFRGIVGGAMFGAFCGIIITVTRMFNRTE